MKRFTTVAELAKMIDHSLLNPTLTDEELREGCKLARELHCASVCVKPYQAKLARQLLKDSDALVCAVIAFPHGNSAIEIKRLEARQAMDDGAQEIDMVLNLGKVLQKDWRYIAKELKVLTQEIHKRGALLKVIFENDLLPDDQTKIKLCELCSQAAVDFVKTSTGYNYVKDAAGNLHYQGATAHDLKLMRKHSKPRVQIKAAGGIRSLEALLLAKAMGATRVGATKTKEILEEAAKAAAKDGRLELRAAEKASRHPRRLEY